jgi:hypothetical protein
MNVYSDFAIPPFGRHDTIRTVPSAAMNHKTGYKNMKEGWVFTQHGEAVVCHYGR